jgi:hypothetical protein
MQILWEGQEINSSVCLLKPHGIRSIGRPICGLEDFAVTPSEAASRLTVLDYKSAANGLIIFPFPWEQGRLVGEHSLTPWSEVILKKLTVVQLFKKSSVFYGTQCFVYRTVKNPPLLLILSRKKSVHLIQIYYFRIKLYIILSFTPRSLVRSLSFSILITISYDLLSPCMLYFHSSHYPWFCHHNSVICGEEYELCSSSVWISLQPPVTSCPSGSNILLQLIVM